MSVHIYKYGLQWLYGRNVSSGINTQFCAYCAHFPGINTYSSADASIDVVDSLGQLSIPCRLWRCI